MRKQSWGKKMKVQTQNQTNPKSQGMEVFLNPTPSSQEEKMKVQQTNSKPSNPPQKVNVENVQNNKEKEIEQLVEQLEQKLKNIKELELSTFNNIVYNKHLMFKLLFIREKIYTIVKDPQTNKSVIVAISPPKWGGSSLRYLISKCVAQYCKAVERQTSKGKIITYTSSSDNVNDEELDDIFD